MMKNNKFDSKDDKGKSSKNCSTKSRSNKRSRNRNSEKKEFPPKENGDINDSSYYYIDPTLRDQLMNFSFNSFQGVPEVIDGQPIGMTGGGDFHFINGNVLAIEVMPSICPISNTNAPTDGINLVGLRNFTLLSANNSKTTNYSPQDVTILMLALQELIKTIGHMTRAFGVLYTYNQRNREWPDTLLTAMKIDAGDFRTHAADYRIEFNKLITTAQKIPFFDNYGAFAKARDIFQDIYVDDMSPLAQSYLFVPESTWIFDEAYDSNGSGLKTFMQYGNTPQYFSVWLSDLSTMIGALLSSTTLNYIYSDVLRLLESGKGKAMQFTLVPDFYQIEFKFSDEINTYIENIMCWGAPNKADTANGFLSPNDVKCDVNDNLILYNPIWSVTGTANGKNITNDAFVNFIKPNPDVEDRVSATRLSARARWIYDGTNTETVKVALGDYYVVRLRMFSTWEPNVGPRYLTFGTVNAVTNGNWELLMEMGAGLDKFRYRPKMYNFHGSRAGDITLGMTGDLCYYTKLDTDFMFRLYDAEMIGEYSLRI